VEDEVAFHIEQKAARLVAEGMSEEDAWREARRRFGDVDRLKEQMTREGERGMRMGAAWDRIRQDLHYAVRQLLKSPGFTVVTMLTLALGIGATTSIFSVVDGILFRPLPFPEPDELVAVWADRTRSGGPPDEWLNFPDYFDLKERSRTLEAVGAWDGGTATLTGLGEPQELALGSVSHDMLPGVLRVPPALGRSFTLEEDLPGAPGTALLADGFWRRALAADPGVIGSTLTLDGEPHTILGILPQDFQPPFLTDVDVWTPLRQSATESYCPRGNACMRVVARLAEGASLADARDEASEIATQLEREHPEENAGGAMTVLSLRDDVVADARPALLVLLGAVGFVLLIACVNVANLLLARATARHSELAVRSALGAGRGRLTGQLLTESGLLALLGGAAGLALAFIGTDLLVGLAPSGTPRMEGVTLNGRVLAFALAVTVLSGLVFGVLPSLHNTRGDLNAGLRLGGRGGSRGRASTRAGGALVSGQVALALILLVGAGLLLRSFQNLRAEDLGFRPAGVLTFQLGLPPTRYPDALARREFLAGLEGRIAALPGVESVGATSWLPLAGFSTDTHFTIEGRPVPPPGQENGVWYRRITPGYPDAMGMRLVAGRWISDDDDENAPQVVVVNEGLARRFFPDGDALGKRLNLNDSSSPQWREIVGVAAEARYFGIRDGSRDALYLPYRQSPTSRIFVALRSSREASGLAGEVRTAVTAADPLLAVADLRPMEALVASSLGPERFVTTLVGLFAGVALALAVVGLYGVVSYRVSQRLREMGVRVALGAERGDVRSLVLKQSLKLVAVGLVGGALGGLGLLRLMDSLLFGVSAADPWTYALVGLILTAVAAAASAIPAARAARVDPITVLKAE
jgi:predicted permease